jgi:DNA-binding Lrp family transcriptional regulator
MTTTRHKLDKIDKQILDYLRKDGRMPNATLSRLIGISPPPCLRRVRALEEAGYIKGYQAVMDEAKLGNHCMVFAGVRLKHNHADDLKAFSARIAVWSEVREAYMIAGDTDYILKIVMPSWEAYQVFLNETLTKAPEVAQVSSAPAVNVIKEAVVVLEVAA